MAVIVKVTVFLNVLVLCFTRNHFPIGGLFEERDENAKLAFQLVMDMINEENTNQYYKLSPIIGHAFHFNTLLTSHAVCSMLPEGIVGIIGPKSRHLSPYVKSLCDIKDIPLIETHWDNNLTKNNYLVNLYPYTSELARSFVNFVKAWEWQSFVILYENDDSLFRVTELLRMYNSSEHTVTLRQLSPDGNHRNMLLEVKRSGERHYIIDSSVGVLEEVLKQAQQVGIMTEDYHYIILNLDISLLDLTPYQYGGSNITGIRLINPNDPQIEKITKRLQHLRHKKGLHKQAHNSGFKIRTETALVIDAVYLLYETLKELRVSKFEITPLYCNDTNSWEKGSTIINYMKAKTLEGLTGIIKFDVETGVRNDFTLEIVELTPGGLITVGSWNSFYGLNISRVPTEEDVISIDENPLRNKMFTVVIALTEPYGMLKNVSATLMRNDRFEGFGIDIIDELSKKLGFRYMFVVQEDGIYGKRNRGTGKWDGMLGEIIEGRADFAITDLTITSERESAVDFTMPFMNLGISILYRKPEPVPPSLLTFAFPFSGEVWMLMAVSYIFVAFCFFVLGRLSPGEWTNPNPCIEEPEYLVNQFSFKNSLWFVVGSLMQQGTEVAPLGLSTRTAAVVWYFFILIMVSSYTANLAAFLTVEELVTPFEDVEQLAAQNEIQYGSKAIGATRDFFSNSNFSVYPQISKYFYEHPQNMKTTNDVGVEKAENENYAFFMESTSIEYVTERHCNLTQVGGALDEKGYGIAMKKDSKYRHFLSTAILELQEAGKLAELKIKWWKEKRGGGQCEKRQAVATPLDLQNLGGVFFVLSVGTVFGIVATLIEASVHTFKESKKKKVSFRQEVKKELKFFKKFKQMAKDVEREDDESTGSGRNNNTESSLDGASLEKRHL